MWKHTASIHKQRCIQLLKSWWLPLIHLSNFSPTTPVTWIQRAKVFQKVGNTILWINLSLWARYSGCSGGGLGKGGRACNTSLEFEYLHWKSRCKMLIGGDDISNDVIILGTCFSMFVYIRACSASRWLAESNSSVDGEPQGNWRWNSNSRDVVASSPSFSHPAAGMSRRAYLQAR